MNQLCLKPGSLAQQEERLGGEGSDAGGLAQILGWGLGGTSLSCLAAVTGVLCNRVTELG